MHSEFSAKVFNPACMRSYAVEFHVSSAAKEFDSWDGTVSCLLACSSRASSSEDVMRSTTPVASHAVPLGPAAQLDSRASQQQSAHWKSDLACASEGNDQKC
jgi:hypothetical protein